MLRPYKFVVQAVVQEVDASDERVLGEHPAEPVTLYGCDALAEYAEKFAAQLASVETPR